jgi:hypothetical protein
MLVLVSVVMTLRIMLCSMLLILMMTLMMLTKRPQALVAKLPMPPGRPVPLASG